MKTMTKETGPGKDKVWRHESSTWKVEAGGYGVQSHTGLHDSGNKKGRTLDIRNRRRAGGVMKSPRQEC